MKQTESNKEKLEKLRVAMAQWLVKLVYSAKCTRSKLLT